MKAKKDPRGRKPIKDKKTRVDLFIEESKVEKLGGKPAVQDLCYPLIEKEVLKIKQ